VPVTIVAAVARNGVIGADGGLPWQLPGDLRRFKELTLGHVLVMGRRTYESIGRPLPGRTTVVVTRDPGWDAGHAEVLVARSVPEALDAAAAIDGEVFVVGGAQVYAAALPLADRLELTWVDGEPAGDTHFPEVDWGRWQEVRREAGDGCAYATYLRAEVGPRPSGGRR
jgi:dihydrofolate reductase